MRRLLATVYARSVSGWFRGFRKMVSWIGWIGFVPGLRSSQVRLKLRPGAEPRPGEKQ
ncbi:hypothetical protein SAMN05443247_07278 [Bradyrhizobium erythrophlei]|jgi:hypothetical protein|nr:hypothetical protein SAMN05443247_07278 [Bradyrhizobium erythrophlei]